jgi:hypothetical protein
MQSQVHILFCEDPFEKNKIDPDFEEEYLSAKENSFPVILFNFDDFAISNDINSAIKRIKATDQATLTIYRGWMLTPNQYDELYQALLSKNYRLINTTSEYQNCHYLPDSLKFIENKTARTIFEKFSDDESVKKLIEKTKIFKDNPVIIKDFVKSEKHDWHTACFVPIASDTENLRQIINNFIALRGKYLNEGIVIREFLNLNNLTNHSKSGMPIKEEYRLFFFDKKLLGMFEYWEEGHYLLSKPDTKEFEQIAQGVESNFFTMDIARKTNGELVIIELGDGQVSGLPNKVDKKEFYQRLQKLCSVYLPA